MAGTQRLPCITNGFSRDPQQAGESLERLDREACLNALARLTEAATLPLVLPAGLDGAVFTQGLLSHALHLHLELLGQRQQGVAQGGAGLQAAAEWAGSPARTYPQQAPDWWPRVARRSGQGVSAGAAATGEEVDATPAGGVLVLMGPTQYDNLISAIMGEWGRVGYNFVVSRPGDSLAAQAPCSGARICR